MCGDVKAVLEVHEVVAETSEDCGVLSGVATAAGVLAQKVEDGCKRAEKVVSASMESSRSRHKKRSSVAPRFRCALGARDLFVLVLGNGHDFGECLLAALQRNL